MKRRMVEGLWPISLEPNRMWTVRGHTLEWWWRSFFFIFFLFFDIMLGIQTCLHRLACTFLNDASKIWKKETNSHNYSSLFVNWPSDLYANNKRLSWKHSICNWSLNQSKDQLNSPSCLLFLAFETMLPSCHSNKAPFMKFLQILTIVFFKWLKE